MGPRSFIFALLFSPWLFVGGAWAATPPVQRPTEAIEPANCVTAECHASVKAHKAVHGPVAVSTCDACHRLTSATTHTFEVARQKAELCTYCHDFSTGAMPVVHKPVINGECLGCHNPHGGADARLLREKTVADVCARCHERPSAQHSVLHSPVKKGDCGGCHPPHASRYPRLLDAVGNELCLACHSDFGAQMAEAKFTHKAMDQGCDTCHNAHGSSYPRSIVRAPAELCGGCHEQIVRQAAQATAGHPLAMDERACLTCHTSHGGNLARLLADAPVRICMSCHDREIKAEGGQVIASMAQISDPAMHKHGPIRDGQCGGCHVIHGGDGPLLLRQANAQRFYQQYNQRNYAMCLGCHDARLARDERADGATEFRNGDRNLHFVHVNDASRGRNCRACHATHASPQERNIRPQVRFGQWDLPIVYTPTPTGGACQSGCHLPYGYDRVNPVAAAPGRTPPRPVPAAVSGQTAMAVTAKFTASDRDGREVKVPDGSGPSVLMFLRPAQSQSHEALRMVRSALTQRTGAQMVLVVDAAEPPDSAPSIEVDGAAIDDAEGTLARRLGVRVWPATIVVGPDAAVVAHVTGAPASLASDLAAYLDLAAGRIDRQALNQRLAAQALVADGPAQRAGWHEQNGRRLLSEGKAAEARNTFAAGLRLAPDSLPLRVGMIEALAAMNDAKSGWAMFNALPADALPLWQRELVRGRLFVAEKKWPQAREALEKALVERPALAEAHLLLAEVFEQQEDWRRAAEHYRSARQAWGRP